LSYFGNEKAAKPLCEATVPSELVGHTTNHMSIMPTSLKATSSGFLSQKKKQNRCMKPVSISQTQKKH